MHRTATTATAAPGAVAAAPTAVSTVGAVDWDHPLDPRPGPQRDHVTSYVETGGVDGHIWHGVPTLLLTTVGRISGRAVRTPLIYARDEDRYLTAASGYGAAAHPQWYRNLLAWPEARLQVGDRVLRATGRPATAEERDTYWPALTGRWPVFEDDQARVAREIPLVLFDLL
ncbi:nitroreductase family deazaflavin-dependent oxidoreductase [Streptomyces antimicrobicus]|uniref:Nitroreductase family deazaflavin-dependent oxidoreductase n=1 Tax=Streptomyces antimicrobicus TaxID=2883108 RepID=A0ABS8B1G3_9ACTN|nr:nitroreductase family deazaflavin-dependent oxidoreductase [Streptomyces antimicrobicus]MCB5178447.1 nitroreductase family deazaflavin-dependent oxidoreductase [Streptomyces antimicrobicus]